MHVPCHLYRMLEAMATELDHAFDLGHGFGDDFGAMVPVPLAHRTGKGYRIHHRPSRVCGKVSVGDIRRGHFACVCLMNSRILSMLGFKKCLPLKKVLAF
jgi:hypothetical protein